VVTVEPIKEVSASEMVDESAEIARLKAENEEAQRELAKLRLQQAQTAILSNDNSPAIIEMKNPENPYDIPVSELRSDVPPCPTLDYRGTKMPEAVKWLETYYPQHALKRLAKFYQKKRQLAEKAARDEAEKKKEEMERAQFPRNK
jgi:hypothetical protein